MLLVREVRFCCKSVQLADEQEADQVDSHCLVCTGVVAVVVKIVMEALLSLALC